VADEELHERIEALAHEEHRLLSARRDGSGLTDAEHTRLQEVEVSLDKTWDLLRQREARRDAGLDPDAVTERDAGVVEGFLQ